MQQGLDYATPVNIPLGFQLAPSLCLCPLLATLLFSLTGDRLSRRPAGWLAGWLAGAELERALRVIGGLRPEAPSPPEGHFG
jgi:hypothetical protein